MTGKNQHANRSIEQQIARLLLTILPVMAAIIIILLVCYAIIVPLTCENNYTRSLTDTMYLNYGKLPPKSSALAWLGVDGKADIHDVLLIMQYLAGWNVTLK